MPGSSSTARGEQVPGSPAPVPPPGPAAQRAPGARAPPGPAEGTARPPTSPPSWTSPTSARTRHAPTRSTRTPHGPNWPADSALTTLEAHSGKSRLELGLADTSRKEHQQLLDHYRAEHTTALFQADATARADAEAAWNTVPGSPAAARPSRPRRPPGPRTAARHRNPGVGMNLLLNAVSEFFGELAAAGTLAGIRWILQRARTRLAAHGEHRTPPSPPGSTEIRRSKPIFTGGRNRSSTSPVRSRRRSNQRTGKLQVDPIARACSLRPYFTP